MSAGIHAEAAEGLPFDGDPRRLWRASQSEPEGEAPDLDAISTRRRRGFDGGRRKGRKRLARRAEVLADQQELLWAHRVAGDPEAVRALEVDLAARVPRRSPGETRRLGELVDEEALSRLSALERGPRVLLVLQGMDASGKGGAVKHVVGSMDPLGIAVTGFGAPTAQERSEHYLRRIMRRLPAVGEIGVFDRSHYEDVLVPAVTGSHPQAEVERRTEALGLFERELARLGFVIVKVFLHLSPEEQLDRLASRLDRPEKHWKYHPSDADARADFDDYRRAYAQVIGATDEDWAPWHIVPADRKWYSRLAIQELLIAALTDLGLEWPEAEFDVETERERLLSS
ncbi:PPK2 family polyphosphate kinase [Nesterenkonia marinintestina]|uniref:PPK2 family polyphosphate kinase n=1 Tax=Nesterenkonia marinintestina TaxID=2979865 RepID=UPI0021BE94D8|nr:PPK2 family polyphosphate kinase [Nesterenkonia sp. GX14115]